MPTCWMTAASSMREPPVNSPPTRAAFGPSPAPARRSGRPHSEPASEECAAPRPSIATTCRLLHASPHRSRAARQRYRLPGVRDLVSIHSQDRDVLVGIVADVQPLAVGTEHRALWNATDDDFVGLRDFLALDLQYGDFAVAVVEPLVLRSIRPAQQY